MLRKLPWLLLPLLFGGFIVGAVLIINHTKTKSTSTGLASTLVSLGDSVAAGDGLPVPSTASANAAACGQSEQAFPNSMVVGTDTKLVQLACRGAKTTTGLLQPQVIGSVTIPAQIATAQPLLAGSDVVLTVGANDVDWTTMLTRCANTACADPANLADFQSKLATLKTNLNTILSAVQAAHPHRVIINTYYSLLSPTDTCFNDYGITRDKIQYVADREADLNTVLVTAARQYNVLPVHIDFGDHLLCDRAAWIQGVFDKAPLHPTVAGQEQIAAQDLRALQ